ncbi:MAG: 16S rRNA (uracil(1498)-N(3))-methyltransferase [Desulfobacula sp.]|nr:16S rRNA (uracil(1498)-N(3))-methyltransferase [Desulfobacula sp.]MDA8135522.1 16S rRNA (uracil(1498)-N(3))-methyltransferase [Desulfobacteraceae bacterium]
MQKFILPDVFQAPSTGTISGQDAKHIVRVLRLKKGTDLEISNGRGKDFSARIAAASVDRVQLEIIEELNSVTESSVHITLCSGMLKDNKMDLVIKYATQLGIRSWVPFFSERSIPSPDAKRMEKRVERWESIARESLKQCRRSRLPEIFRPLDFETVLTLPESSDIKLAFWEKASARLDALQKKDDAGRIFILIGPEGGFSDHEVGLAQQKGFVSCSLGPRILRAETASIASCTLVQHIFGDM